MKRNVIALVRLKEVLRYDPDTGLFWWIIKRNGTITGKPAGVLGKYVRIKIDGKSYSASCMAWLWMTGEWPTQEVDHKDLNKHNNKWENLRAATRSQNTTNIPRRKSGSNKYKGVTRHKHSGKWSVCITIDGKQRTLGRFHDQEKAAAAYAEAAKKHYGEFARLK